MFCTKCGTDISTEVRYCYKCGASLLQDEPPPTELPHSSEAPQETSSVQESRPATVRQPNFLVKHWRGDYSLGFSYWVIGSLLTVIVVAVTAVVGSMSGLRELGQSASGAVILTFFGIVITLTLWQLVGIWRSADKHVQRGGKTIWAGLAKAMVVLGLLRAVGDFSTQGIPLISEGAKLFVGIDNTPPHAIRLLRDGTELELAGGMPFGTTDAVKKFLDAAPAIQVIHLNSQGGRMNEAYQLYKLIKERNLITYTSADCASACSIAFLAGHERYIGERGRLGFHSASIGGLSGDIAMQLNDDVRQTLRSHRVPDSFIDHALSTSPKDMWYPGTAELLRANVINSVVDSRYFGLSGVTQWRDAHKIETEMLAIPIYSALAQYDQQNYARLRDILITGIQKGRAQIEIQKDIRSIFVNELIPAYLKKAPDDALIRYWRSQIAEMRHFAKLNSQYCADFIFPQFAKSAQDLQGLLPKDLQMEDMDALATVVKGVATNPQAYGTSPQIHHDIEAVVMKVAQKHPMALKAVSNPANYKNDAGALCGGVIALYSEILAIPSSSRSGPILRYMLNAK